MRSRRAVAGAVGLVLAIAALGVRCDVGFDRGGHTWVGHDGEVRAAIVKLLMPSSRP